LDQINVSWKRRGNLVSMPLKNRIGSSNTGQLNLE